MKEKEIPAAAASRNLKACQDASALPRERALRDGIAALSDTEIMAILLGTGTQGKNVLDLAAEILKGADGHLSKLACMSPKELVRNYNGMGQGKSLTLLAALELGRRAAKDAENVQKARTRLNTSNLCYEVMRSRFTNLNNEEFWVLLLNNGLMRITDVCVGRGTQTSTLVDVRTVIKYAMENNACAMVLCHNHPSGTLEPSGADDILTRKITEAAKLFDVKVIDHLIITDSGYYSYSDKGRL